MVNVLAVDAGGTKTEAILADVRSFKIKILEKNRLITRGLQRKDYLKELKRLIIETKVNKAKAISFSVPGYEINNRIECSPNLKALEDINLKAWAKSNFRKKVFIENDANCFALAESMLGAYKKASILVGIIIGSGVGSGIVINHKLYRGWQGIGAEIGHTTMIPKGRVCGCGKRGCVEAYISGESITKRYLEAGGSIPSPDPVKIWKAKKRDVVAGEIIDETVELMAIMFSNIANLLNPEIIVVGGGVSNLPFFKIVNQRIKKYLIKGLKLEIVKNTLGDDAGILGAALIGAGR